MFSDSYIQSTGFSASPEIPRVQGDATSQTPALPTDNQSTQTAISQDSTSQTEVLHALETPPAYDSERLLNFLNKIYPELSEELNKNYGYPISRHLDSCEDFSVSKLHSIDSQKSEGKAVSCFSWNSTGRSLAVAFSESTHESWCTHEGQVHIYRTTEDAFENSPPTYLLRTYSCVTSVSFHPSMPAILIAGLHNGKILAWDLQKDDPLLPGLGDGFIAHSDTITKTVWIEAESPHLFVTAGKDGKILVWKISIATKSLCILEQYFISSSHFTQLNQSVNDNSEILSISFWSELKNDFVVAAGGGNILHCSRLAAQTIPLMKDYNDPVEMAYEQHVGIVTCISCTVGDLFASCGTDNEINVYKRKQKYPVHVILSEKSLFGIQWVDEHAAMIASWGDFPQVCFYKVLTKDKLKSHEIKLEEPDAIVTAAKINRYRKGIMAVGTMKGDISIWMFPHFSE